MPYIVIACVVNFVVGLLLTVVAIATKPNYKQFLFMIALTPVFWLVMLVLYIFIGPLFWIYRRLGDEHA